MTLDRDPAGRPRRLPALRIASVMEAIVVLAVGIACARAQVTESHPRLALSKGVASEWLRVVFGAWLTGVALASGVFLWIETLRGRRPSEWGLGRWIWCVSAIKIVLFLAFDAGLFLVGAMVKFGTLVDVSFFYRMAGLLGIALGRDFAITLIAVCATAMLTQKLVDPRPDAREWTGRIFASLVIASNLTAQWLYVLRS